MRNKKIQTNKKTVWLVLQSSVNVPEAVFLVGVFETEESASKHLNYLCMYNNNRGFGEVNSNLYVKEEELRS